MPQPGHGVTKSMQPSLGFDQRRGCSGKDHAAGSHSQGHDSGLDCAHTDGDLYVHFERQNVLAVGGVLSGQGWPTMDYITGGWIGGMVGGTQRLLTIANEQTRIVPANGPVLSYADLKTQASMYATIYERLSTLLNRGRSPSEAVAAKPTKEFDAQMGNPDEFVRRAFESLWAYLSPDA